jgi:type II secretory pathway pseudopilin PulG
MKILQSRRLKQGFTLIEVMVAMVITIIIVTVLVSITSVALDTWNRNRAELRTAQQGKAMIDTMAEDFQSYVSRRGSNSEWLSAITQAPTSLPGPTSFKSANACDLNFFTAATDRYNGQLGTGADKGGDISLVSYKLDYKDPISNAPATGYETFVLYRQLINPDKTYASLLGASDLTAAMSPFIANTSVSTNFVSENIYQFTLTFHVQVSKVQPSGQLSVLDQPVTLDSTASGQSATKFIVNGNGIVTDCTGSVVTPAELKAGRLTSVDISVSVISDAGINQLSKRTFTASQQADFLAKNSYQFTKSVKLSGN